MKHLEKSFAVSERRACRLVGQHRSSQRYQPEPPDDEPRLLEAMAALVKKHPRYGYRRIGASLRRQGWQVNRKRIYRLWKREGYRVPRNTHKKRGPGASENACHLAPALHQDDVWCWDFIFDRDEAGRLIKWLTVTDEFTRESLVLLPERSITAERVIQELLRLLQRRGVPGRIRSDNGPELIAQAIQDWLGRAGVATLYVAPGAPWENGYAESFHARLRDEFLNAETFANLAEAQALARIWQREYNEERPHSSLGYLPPAEFAARLADLPVGATPLPPGQPADTINHQQRTLTLAGT